MKLFKRTDLIIIIAVLLAAAAISVPRLMNSDKLTAEIYVDGKLEETIDLSSIEKEYIISPNSEPKVEITVGNNEIYFSHAECKDKLCVKSGKLTSGGETAACLPARVVISVKSIKNKTDIMTY
ncbi:uncharacterized protein BN710_01247 [Ruminococcus sp. CAG:563]|nr:uncharacterized protein BN710_01247 [Ruminococcus sp. CAG:563]